MAYWKDRKAGRGAATIRGHPEDQVRSDGPRAKAAWSRPIAPWGCCWPCGINRRRHWSSSMKRSKTVPNSPSRAAIRHGSWPPRWTTGPRREEGRGMCAKQALEIVTPGNSPSIGIRWPPPRPRRASSRRPSKRRKRPSSRPAHAGRRSHPRHPAASGVIQIGHALPCRGATPAETVSRWLQEAFAGRSTCGVGRVKRVPPSSTRNLVRLASSAHPTNRATTACLFPRPNAASSADASFSSSGGVPAGRRRSRRP